MLILFVVLLINLVIAQSIAPFYCLYSSTLGHPVSRHLETSDFCQLTQGVCLLEVKYVQFVKRRDQGSAYRRYTVISENAVAERSEDYATDCKR